MRFHDEWIVYGGRGTSGDSQAVSTGELASLVIAPGRRLWRRHPSPGSSPQISETFKKA
jgi:hypothetical protein